MIKPSILIVLFCFIPFVSHADETRLLLLPFDSAELIDHEHRLDARYQLALGSYKKKDNRWQPEVSKRIKGTLIRETYELPKGTDEEEVFEFYRQQLQTEKKSTENTLYECARRNCGESNNWANDHFRIKQLYGSDRNQFYGVYQFANRFITLYIVRRGNRRVYVQIDHVTVSE